jgi:hypothetical protein
MLAAACSPSTSQSTAPSTSPAAAISPQPSPSKSTSLTLASIGTIGWDGVDGRMMFVQPLGDPTHSHTSVTVWTFAGTQWRPALAPALALDQFGFRSLALAYDSGRHREILVVGLNTEVQTWEWDGKQWLQIHTPHSARGFVRGAYSPDLHSLVGWDGTTYFYDTWLYDGSDWRAVRTTATPFTNYSWVQYDPGLHSVVALSQEDYRTWAFDGANWFASPSTLVDPNLAFTMGRQSPAATLDPQTGLWVIFGGYGNAALDDTWIGGGGAWTKVSPAAAPSARASAFEGWDPVREQVMLFGGVSNVNKYPPTYDSDHAAEAWGWDGATWTQLAGPGAPTQASGCLPSTSYGLLNAAGNLQVINTCDKVTASAPMTASPVASCSTGVQANVPPAVSSSDDLVYFRDGETKIRSLSLDGLTADVTSVPGGGTTTSFFSVSPDDRRIAVVVEDLSPTTSINERLYVEDLNGGGNHVDIFSTSQPKSGGTTLFPEGWHQGSLVLAVMPACGSQLSGLSPVSWHVVDPATGSRQASVDAANCGTLNLWPSRAGIACLQSNGTGLYDWGGAMHAGYSHGAFEQCQIGVSPSGLRFLYSGPAAACGANTVTYYFGDDVHVGSELTGHAACLWINDNHLLAPDAVITIGPPTSQFASPVAQLTVNGSCAGRFPGTL